MCRDRGIILNSVSGKTDAEFEYPAGTDLVNSTPLCRFSPDGRYFITFRSWSSVALRDSSTGKLRIPLINHSERATAVAISADGQILATGADDGVVHIVDTSSGKELGKLIHQTWVNDLSFDSSGDRLLVSTNRGGGARLWNWRTGKMVCPAMALDKNNVFAGEYLNGTPWLVTQSGNSILRFWDSASGKPLTPPLSLLGCAYNGALQFCLDGQKLVSFSASTEPAIARVFDLAPIIKSPLLTYTNEQLLASAELHAALRIINVNGYAPLTNVERLQRLQSLASVSDTTTSFSEIPNLADQRPRWSKDIDTPRGPLLCINDEKGAIKIYLRHADAPGSRFANWTMKADEGRKVLDYNSRPLILGGDWEIEIELSNGITSERQSLAAVGEYRDGVWRVAVRDLFPATTP
jgi:hypothetical protein